MRKFFQSLVGLGLLVLSAAGLQAASVIDFESATPLAATPLTVTSTDGLLTGNFTTIGGGALDIENSTISSGGIAGFTGNYLIVPSANVGQTFTLNIGLSTPQSSATFPIAILGNSLSSLTINAFLGGTQVGTFTASTTSIVTNFYSIGTATVSLPAGTFDSLQIPNPIPGDPSYNGGPSGFGVDDLAFSTPAASGVPEPASFALVVLGVAGLLSYVRHRRHLPDPSAATK